VYKVWVIFLTILLVPLATACGNRGDENTLPPPPTLSAELSSTNSPGGEDAGDSVGLQVTTGAPDVLATPTTPATAPAPPTLAPLPTSTKDAANSNQGMAGEEGLISEFGDDRNPLTGEVVSDPANLQRRPLAVKLSNAPAIYTRPQSGLNDADLVFEHTTEGNLTRFTAIIYGKTPPRVGPVRSARLIDIELPAMYDAALAYSGSSNGVAARLQNSDFSDRILYAWEKGYYRTGEDKPIEHTLYATPELLWEALDDKGMNNPPNFTSTNVFSEQPPEGGTPASALNLDYNWTLVNWRFDPAKGRYLRWADGEPHLDGNTLEQVSAANVIVIAPYHAYDATICEQINVDGTCAAQSVEVQLWDSGGGAVFRDGQRYEVTWERLERTDSLTFKDSSGNPFPLKIGNSWVQLVPTWLETPLTVVE
jgi:hypothetical protein